MSSRANGKPVVSTNALMAAGPEIGSPQKDRAMHLGLEPYVPMALYLCAMVAFGLSVFWKPQVGLYFLIPLLPLQTVRDKLIELPLGNKLVDIISAWRGAGRNGQRWF